MIENIKYSKSDRSSSLAHQRENLYAICETLSYNNNVTVVKNDASMLNGNDYILDFRCNLIIT
jgi:hypothetical protein